MYPVLSDALISSKNGQKIFQKIPRHKYPITCHQEVRRLRREAQGCWQQLLPRRSTQLEFLPEFLPVRNPGKGLASPAPSQGEAGGFFPLETGPARSRSLKVAPAAAPSRFGPNWSSSRENKGISIPGEAGGEWGEPKDPRRDSGRFFRAPCAFKAGPSWDRHPAGEDAELSYERLPQLKQMRLRAGSLCIHELCGGEIKGFITTQSVTNDMYLVPSTSGNLMRRGQEKMHSLLRGRGRMENFPSLALPHSAFTKSDIYNSSAIMSYQGLCASWHDLEMS